MWKNPISNTLPKMCHGYPCSKMIQNRHESICILQQPQPYLLLFIISKAFLIRNLSFSCLIREVLSEHRYPEWWYLWGDDKERGLGVELCQRLGDVCAINVWHKPDTWSTLGVRLQRLSHHQGTLKSADANNELVHNARNHLNQKWENNNVHSGLRRPSWVYE